MVHITDKRNVDHWIAGQGVGVGGGLQINDLIKPEEVFSID